MKKHEKEIERYFLNSEREVLSELEATYKQALKDVNGKLKVLNDDIDKLIQQNPENETLIRSKIYQKQYQETLKKQITNNLDILKDENLKTVEAYMAKMYEDGYLSNMYNIQKYGVPITMPINQDLLIKSLTYDTAKIPLSTRLYDNVEDAKRRILNEVTRGISSGMSTAEIARNIENSLGVSRRKANQIAQNEGARVRIDAIMDSAHKAKERGADLVKKWDATLDNKTRPVHRELDQQHAELDDPFHSSIGDVMQPKGFGLASQDINCRCAVLIVPRWDVEDDAQRRDNISGELINASSYADWKKKYYKQIEDETILNGAKIAQETRNAIRGALNKAGFTAIVGKVLGDTVKEYAVNESNTTVLKKAMATEDYQEYIDLINNNENVDIQRLYANYADGLSGLKKKKGAGVYKPSLNTIEFDFSAKKGKYSTLAHEYGHYFDAKVDFGCTFKEIDAINKQIEASTGYTISSSFFKRLPSSSDEFLAAVRKDKDYLKPLIGADLDKILKANDASHGVQDAIDGMFGWRIYWGHGDKYYNRTYSNAKTFGWQKALKDAYNGLGMTATNQNTVKNYVRNYETASEIWANVQSAIVNGGEELEYVKKYLPNSYETMLKLLQRVK